MTMPDRLRYLIDTLQSHVKTFEDTSLVCDLEEEILNLIKNYNELAATVEKVMEDLKQSNMVIDSLSQNYDELQNQIAIIDSRLDDEANEMLTVNDSKDEDVVQ